MGSRPRLHIHGLWPRANPYRCLKWPTPSPGWPFDEFCRSDWLDQTPPFLSRAIQFFSSSRKQSKFMDFWPFWAGSGVVTGFFLTHPSTPSNAACAPQNLARALRNVARPPILGRRAPALLRRDGPPARGTAPSGAPHLEPVVRPGVQGAKWAQPPLRDRPRAAVLTQEFDSLSAWTPAAGSWRRQGDPSTVWAPCLLCLGAVRADDGSNG